MKNRCRYIIVCLVALLPLTSGAQQLNHVQGEVLVKLRSDVESENFANQMNILRSSSTIFHNHKPVIKSLNIHLYRFDENAVSIYKVIEDLMLQPEVEIAQVNHIVRRRSTVPDDNFFNSQWQYINTGQLAGSTIGADLDMDLAWDITTGGLTPLGDTIVVCVIDDGLNPDHLDFGDNIWLNYAEIPDNGIDDDGNGYVDDYKGWDVDDNDGDPMSTRSVDFHGTPVAGIIGAKGNNSIGVAGVNWDVKLMIVRNNSTNEADVLAAYNYPLTMRKLYNLSDGQAGAFVVATNASWGVDNGQPADAPLWCAMYDTLGAYGILNAGATANENYNIDETGDLPTACPSEHLISVTNLDETDQKVTSAGFGLETIDLGAYGENTFTVETPNGYDDFGGTSGATPHVAGAIGLLYSAPCETLANLARNNPAAASQFVKQAILEGTTINSSLENITVTGARLNINGALTSLLLNCGPCPKPFNLKSTEVFTSAIILEWVGNDSINEVEVQYRTAGSSSWTSEIVAGEMAALNGLEICTDYEIRIKGICENDTSALTESIVVRTDGCCDVPIDLQLEEVSESNIRVSWSDVTAATEFELRIREEGSISWDEYISGQAMFDFTTVNSCSPYEIQVKSLCSDSMSNFSASLFVSTPGCGGCLDLDYCEVAPGDTDFEFIDIVRIGEFENLSGDNDGYGDFTLMSLPHLEREKTYTFQIVPGLNEEVELDENYLVWIDFDSDGTFTSAENVIALESSDSTGVSADVTIPANAVLGSTRMRVGMRFSRDALPCTDNPILGEYEDYCLTIDENTGVGNQSGTEEIRIDFYPNPVSDRITFSATDYTIANGQLTIFDQSGKPVRRIDLDLRQNNQRTLDLADLPAGIYIIHYIAADRPYRLTRKLVKL